MPEWTHQQLSAIEARGRSIIVSAAAGSGKTAVLVERLLRILSDYEHPVRADRIIVVTFTNDAAAQMKQRLSKALTMRLSELEDSPEYEWLLEQRVHLASAKISTVHSFCFDLIRENADALDVQPNFGIAEPGQESICQRRALDAVMERWTAESPDMQMLYDHFCVRSDSDIETLILGIADFLGSVAFPEQWFRNARRLAADPDALFERVRETTCNALREVIALYQKAEPFARDALPDVADNKFVIRLHEELNALREQLAYLENEPMESLCKHPLEHEAAFERFAPPRKNVDAKSKEAFTLLRTIVKQQYQRRVLGIFHDESTKKDYKRLDFLRFFAEDADLMAKLIPALLELVEAYLEALRAEKQEQNILAFSDAEELTLRLLADTGEDDVLSKSDLALQLSDQYDLIMVDEYQDTNDKQDHIFKLLSHGTRIDRNGIHYGDNAFLVGDVKQSIYSFRQADPDNFRAVIAESSPLSAASGMALIFLNRNFRSAPGVLDFVNALFGAVMRMECGEVEYNEDEQLNFGSRLYGKHTAKTQILLAADDEVMPAGLDLQAECVADTIASMIGNTPVLIPGENDTVTSRPAQAGDFCILLRSVTGYGEAFIDALHRRGIGVAADMDSGLLDLPEIHLIRSLLRVADNPMTDTALAAVMLSAVGGFTAEELAELKLYADEKRLFKQMQTLRKSDALPAGLESLRKKVTDCLELIALLRDAAVRLPLEDAIWEIYAQTDLLALQSVYDDAVMRRTHLDAFARMAGEYSRFADLTAQSCLSGWLRYLDRLEAGGRKLEIKPGAGVQGCVRIKTIHRSKGLEFPFVFAAKLDTPFSKKPSQAAFHAASDGLLGLRVIDRKTCVRSTTAAYWYLLDDVYRRQTSEELRLLYVALTRAEQQLFLVVDHPEGSKSDKTAAGKLGGMLELDPTLTEYLASCADCMQDWLLYFLLSGRDREHMRRLMQGEESHGEYADYGIWHYQPYEQPQLPAPQVKPDAGQIALLREQISCTYRTEQSALVSKNTVTQLAHPETGVLDLMHKPQFTLESSTGSKLMGSARGTAVHTIMQLIDFTLAEQDPQAALDALLAEGAVSEPEYQSITAAHLEAFFRSELYRRIAAAKTVERERKIFVELGTLELPAHPEIIEPYRGTDSILIGTMDLVFREPDGWVILDYKTDHATAEEKLMREYTLQLRLYCAAAEQIFGERVKALYLWSFSLDSALEIGDLP